ncbi:MAG: sulfate adenylyltransferase [Candidatus Hydrothermarchaeales archaeon]
MREKQTPVGGKLVDRTLKENKREKAKTAAQELPRIKINKEGEINLEMIASGVLSPNEGFMLQEDFQAVLDQGRLANGTPWTIPITLAPLGDGNTATIKALKDGDDIALVNGGETPIAILHLEEKYTQDKEERAAKVFGTTETQHPGVDNLFTNSGDTLLAGKIDLLERSNWGPFEEIRLEPKDTWRIFYEEKGWKTIVGFQTANPMHRGHEHLQKCSLEIHDGLFINPIVETTRKAYFRNEFRIKAYEAALKTYYPEDRVVMAPLRVTMQYAGPKEAILHGLIRRNFGCTHIILGRDHAGFGNYYSKYAAQELYKEYDEELGIEPIFFREAFYCTRCASIATEKTCPHSQRYRVTMSGTGIQDILRYGYAPPKEAMRPEVTQIALQGIQPKGVDTNGVAMNPPSDTIKGLFPYYLTHHRLGGYPRGKALDPEKLEIKDIDIALMDVRNNATKIYKDVYDEITHYFDLSRNISERQRTDALRDTIERQKRLIKALGEKVKMADEKVHDPFMYQDREEAKKELTVAKKILMDLQRPVEPEEFKERIWNPLDFERYRHTLDVTGEVCPTPLIETQRMMADVQDGEELLIVTDFPQSVETIPHWAVKKGYDVAIDRKGTKWEVLITKKAENKEEEG